MIILGIDPGYERLGIAILEKKPGLKKEKVIFSECFKTSSKNEFSDRLLQVGVRVRHAIEKFGPETLAIETLFLNTNQKTAMQVASVRGVVLYEAKKAGLAIFEASPPQIKNAVSGYGRADKQQVIKMVKMLVDFEKNQGKNRESDDELDAIAVALTAFAYIKK